ncbi:hypothetical protein GCM10010405_46520 [Streptomyces macrosporus]|uniref:C2H2-type domain-containing protein n=1 Tax=Streptomyces macrosporus TaxID=44032 RepID=A0ABP5XIQ0_9ACTN
MPTLEQLLAETIPDGTFGGARPRPPQPRPSTPRGHCTACDKPYALTTEGLVRHHDRPRGTPCPGSRRLPSRPAYTPPSSGSTDTRA